MRPESYSRLAGASPVAVGMPVRRVAGSGRAERSARLSGASKALGGLYGPWGGEQSCGPNLSCEPLQPREIDAERRRSRAGHVTAKATDWAHESGSVQDPPGVWKAARSDSLEWNRRDPPRQPPSGKDPSYKPRAKWAGAGRESEGLILPLRLGETREEERGPALVVLAVEGKYEGMVARPNNPREQVRELQYQLFKIAKRHRRRGIHAFAEGIYRGDVPVEAWNDSAILETCMRLEKTIGQPCAGNPHARLERGPQETGPYGNCA